MDSLAFNKISAAVLVALIASYISGYAPRVLMPDQKLGKPIYPTDIPDVIETSSASPAKKGAEPISALLASADIEAGKKVAKKCVQCHTFEQGGANKVGPNLWDILGKKIAHLSNFAYSSAFQKHGGTWGYEDLNKYLYKPRAFMPGTKMAFVGLSSVQDRANIIAYLRSLSSSPLPLPPAPKKEEPKAEKKAEKAPTPSKKK